MKVSVYFFTYLGLLILLAATVALSFLNLGGMREATALIIAGFKAVLILLFLMHVRESHFYSVLVFGVVVFLISLLLLFMSDFSMR